MPIDQEHCGAGITNFIFKHWNKQFTIASIHYDYPLQYSAFAKFSRVYFLKKMFFVFNFFCCCWFFFPSIYYNLLAVSEPLFRNLHVIPRLYLFLTDQLTSVISTSPIVAFNNSSSPLFYLVIIGSVLVVLYLTGQNKVSSQSFFMYEFTLLNSPVISPAPFYSELTFPYYAKP